MNEALIKYTYIVSKYVKHETGDDIFLDLLDLVEKSLHDFEKELANNLWKEADNYIKGKKEV